MKKGILVRILGGLFLVIASLNLIGLASTDVRESIISLPAVSIRYSLMLIASIGLLFLRKWGVYVLAAMVLINWILFFLIYEGNSGIYPVWISLIGPILFGGLFYWSWKDLR